MPRFSIPIRMLTFQLVTVLHAAGMAHAEDLGVWPSGESLILPLNVLTLEGSVAVEIDAFDVTDFVTLIDGQLVIAPDAFVSGGLHDVTVFLWDGEQYDTVASYSVSVPLDDSDPAPALSVTIDAAHEAGVVRTNGKSETFATSYGAVSIETHDNRLTGHIGYLATTQDDTQINGNAVDIAEYSIELRHSGTHFDFLGRLGHQALDYDPALIGGVSLRGVSLQVSRPNGRFEASIVAAQSSDALGHRNITGLNDAADRLSGGQLAWRPFSQSDFRISTQIYQGKGIPYGGLVVGEGSGWSVGFDGTAGDGRFRYGAFLGETTWDEDSGGGLFAAETASALLGYAAFDVLSPEFGAKSLTLGLAYEAVELSYFSLANPNLAVGGETLRLTADYTAERLGLSLLAEGQWTNFGGPAESPTDRILTAGLDGYYDLGTTGHWENTTLRFGVTVNRQDRLITPFLAPDPQNFTALHAYVGIEKYSDVGSWLIEYAYLNEDEKSADAADEISHSLTVGFDRQFGARFSLNGSASLTSVQAPSEDWLRQEVNLDVRYDIVPNKLSLSAGTGLTRSGQLSAEDGEYVALELAWTVAPSAELVLSGARYGGAYASDNGSSDDKIVGLFLRANTNIFR